MSRYTVELYNADNMAPSATAAAPSAVRYPTWKREHNEVGDGAFTVQLDDASIGLIETDQIVVFRLDGVPRHAAVLERLHYASKAASRDAQILTANGRGALALLERAVIEPSTGTGHLPVEEVRPFNWTAFGFDDSGVDWVAATEYATVTDTTTFWTGLPQDFPDYGEPDGTSVPKYTGPSTGDETDAPEGDCYYRRTITTGDVLFDLFMACDNYGEAYLDGVLILTSPGFGITRHIEGGIQVTAGDHVLAFKVHNYPDDPPPGGNPTHLIYSAVSLTVDGLIGDVITFSGSLTKINEYPAAPPGMTVGAAMKTLIDEAQAATPPRLVGVTYDFDETLDSNGVAWDQLPDLSGRVGDDLLTFVRQLVDSGLCDIRMTPGLVFQMFKPGTLGATTSAAPDFLTIDHEKRSAPVTSALVKWRDTYTAYESAEEPAVRRFLRLEQAPSAEAGFAIAQAVVDARKIAPVAVSATIDADIGPNANEPYTGFEEGDTIPVPMIDGTPSDEQVQAITLTIDDTGRPIWAIDIKDRILANEERIDRLQKRMLGGALAGLSNTPSFLNTLGSSKGTLYRLATQSATYIPGDDLESPQKQVDRTSDIFWLKVRLDVAVADDVTVEMRVNGSMVLSCTVPAGDQMAIAWLAVGTSKVATSDYFTFAITEPAAPPRLITDCAFR